MFPSQKEESVIQGPRPDSCLIFLVQLNRNESRGSSIVLITSWKRRYC